ncbi:zinc-dependent peptidase [Xanthomonas albilineans]|uniref:M90 family metallopeptidase n=1 Tax=Xanthomonas albilineans TaxID=29447 RepID=UPI0005F35F26|nr:M90 family metallopeptidase [Xanthomonas albilineans]
MAQLPAGDVPLISRWLRARWPARAAIDETLWREVRHRCAWVASLDTPREQRLRGLAAEFLHRKTISPLGGLQLDAPQCSVLAALCCLPLLEFGASGLHGWSQLLVYPNAFRVQRSHIDAAGVLHEWEDELIGESWDNGPLILSWADVQADLDDPRAGYCVAVHEMAHKLDALDGVLDGTPLLPRTWQRQWAADFQRNYDAFCKRVDRGRASEIDAYAAEAPEEFFAVVSEYHFSAPQRLQRAMPDVAAHLQRFYGPSPFATD